MLCLPIRHIEKVGDSHRKGLFENQSQRSVLYSLEYMRVQMKHNSEEKKT